MSTASPSRGRMLDWLAGSVGARGEVVSWSGGFPYPEVGGLWLTTLSRESGFEASRRDVSRWLIDCVDAHGRVGRGGVRYAFDTACVRVGLHAAGASGCEAVLESMDAALLEDVEARRAAHPPGDVRWSTRFSAHMLKLAWALGPAHGLRLLEAVALVQDPDGRVRNRADDPTTYLHAACYALEGLLRLRELDDLRGRVEPMLQRGVAWLARLQAPDGTLPAGLDVDGTPTGSRPSDIIAQSLRLWTRVDPQCFADACARALNALAERQSPEGAIIYSPDRPHRNTWCTLFALQGLDWSMGRTGTLA